MTHYHATLTTPVGTLVFTVNEAGALTKLYSYGGADTPVGRRWPASVPAPLNLNPELCAPHVRQLTEYFAGTRREFDLPLAAAGTPFQRRVWDALCEIPYGETVSYGEIARRLGLPPGASRAVGAANGANPIAIVVPCHRVIGANGTLTGYAGGLAMKRKLLELEGVLKPEGLFAST